jgi:hypothetical protein
MLEPPQAEIERETQRRLAIYTRCIDAREWTRLSEVFSEDCVKERLGTEGVSACETAISGRSRIVEDLKTNLGRLGPTQHLLGNHEVEVRDGEVISRTYVRAYHRGAGRNLGLWLDILGEYRVQWQLLADGWRAVRWSLRIFDSLGDPKVVTDK